MPAKPKTALAFVIIMPVITFAVIHLTHKPRPTPAADVRCRKNLHALLFLVRQYAAFNRDALPPNLQAVMEDRNPSIFYHESPGEPFRYGYVDWSKKYTYSQLASQELPLIYDLDTHRHYKPVAYILFSNETIRADQNATWLVTFQKSHPELLLNPEW